MLFTDIEGSTRLLQQLGDRYADVLAECRQLLRAAFQHQSGHEVDTQGDAFFVAFARAIDAVLAAVDAQRALASHAWPQGAAVRVRMGLHTGEPSLTSEGYVGLDVHRAARIMSAGHGGQVLLSQTTRDLVEHALPEGAHLQDLGAHRLKDLQQQPSHLFQVVIAGLPINFPPLRTLDTQPNNLPIQPTPFIGREKEVAAVTALLRREDVRLLTLTGPGGTGKTRLGLQVAAELSEVFADGVFFVNLAPISDPSLVVPTIAQTLDVREAAGQPLLDLMSAFLREKQVLLLLDNFEQVASAALEVADLLTVCPRLKVLMTSREMLHVRAEREFAVPVLRVPDPKHLPDLVTLSQYEAVALFISRARAVKPDFQVTHVNAPALAEICVRLDGLPLAIELAAARSKLLPPQALLARLGHRLEVLTSGARDAPARQQTLRNTVAWSYDLLTSEEQRLFRRLSVFVGGCTLEAVEALYATLDVGAGRVLEEVASLLDKSLLQQAEYEGEESRLVMLETIREYGLEALAASGEMEATRQAHAAYYLALAEAAGPKLVGPQQAVWLERLEREHDNLRSAMQWSLEQRERGHSMEMALRLGGVMQWFWQVRGLFSEGRAFLKRALAASEGVVSAVRAKALHAAANLALIQGDYDQLEALCEESLTLFREQGDKQGIAHTLSLLGRVAFERGNITPARVLFEESLALSREVGDKENIAWSLFSLAWLASEQGEYASARLLHEESLAMHRELGNEVGIATSLLHLARDLFDSQGDPVTARSLLEEGLTLFREVSDKQGIADSFYFLGQLVLGQGDAATACSLGEESLVLYREMGDWEGIAGSLLLLARVTAFQGDYAAARALYEESLAITRKLGAKLDIALGLEGLAGVVAAQGEPAWAARLWGAAEALREVLSTPLTPVERADYERAVAAARTQLGEKAFAAAWAQGRSMTPEQALATQTPEVESISGGVSSAPSAKLPTTSLDGLSARELEVLRLLATGLTDAQIAEQLVLSLYTIHAHLRTIYSKLGVTSRSAATRYAFEHHLA